MKAEIAAAPRLKHAAREAASAASSLVRYGMARARENIMKCRGIGMLEEAAAP